VFALNEQEMPIAHPVRIKENNMMKRKKKEKRKRKRKRETHRKQE
jgi:hypothetical protein